MKLKYKKMIIVVTMCTMGIGLVTFSLTSPKSKSSTAVEETGSILENSEKDQAEKDLEDVTDVASTEGTVSPEPIAAVDAKSEEVELLEKDAYTNINKLMKKYLKAKLKGEISGFEKLVNDTSIIDIDDLQRKTKYIESYENITCYTRKGPEPDSYVVYAYHEVKFTGIDTLAPAMNEFYVKTNEAGDVYIYLGEIDEETEAFFTDVRNSEEVMELIYSVNDELQLAVDGDTALAEFYAKLEESAKDVSSNVKDN